MWTDNVLCTVADIRGRFLSPEVVLAVTKYSNTPFAYSVNGNTITTAIAHGLSSWNFVQFQTTGTLPSPLTIGTNYYAIVLSPNVFSVTNTFGGNAIVLTGSGSGSQTFYNSTLDAQIQSKIAIASRWIYQSLQLEVQNRVPMIATRWMNRKRGQVDYFAQEMHREFEILAKTAQIPIVPGVYDGSVIDLYMLLSMTQGLVPRTFSAPGAPINGVNGTYAGQAYPGAIYIDTLADRMYYQTGTLACPIWTRPTSSFVLDNLLNASSGRIQTYAINAVGTGYLLGDTGTINGGSYSAVYVVTAVSGTTVTGIRLANYGTGYTISTAGTTATAGTGTGLTIDITGFWPNVLLDAAIDYTLWAMAQDGMVRNRATYDDPNTWAFGADLEGILSKRAKERLKNTVPLLELDIDCDGGLSDWEAELTQAPRGLFA